MTILDTARAWKKLLEGHYSLARPGHGRPDIDEGYTWLGDKLGKDRSTIRDIVQMLDEPEYIFS